VRGDLVEGFQVLGHDSLDIEPPAAPEPEPEAFAAKLREVLASS
jgi:hypothetical protein